MPSSAISAAPGKTPLSVSSQSSVLSAELGGGAQPLMAVPAFLFVETFKPSLPYGIGFAAGAMFYMVFVELLPEAYGKAPRPSVSLLTALALIAMLLFQNLI